MKSSASVLNKTEQYRIIVQLRFFDKCFGLVFNCRKNASGYWIFQRLATQYVLTNKMAVVFPRVTGISLN